MDITKSYGDMSCTQIYNRMTYSEIFDTFSKAGLPDDAAKFCTEEMPEYIGYAFDRLKYGTGDGNIFGVLTEEELEDFLNGNKEYYYNKHCGIIVRDDSFDGVLVMGGWIN